MYRRTIWDKIYEAATTLAVSGVAIVIVAVAAVVAKWAIIYVFGGLL